MRKSTKRLIVIDLIILMLCLLGGMAYLVYRTWQDANEVVVHEQGSEIVREMSSEIGQYEFVWDGKLESTYGGGRTYTLAWNEAEADYYQICILRVEEDDDADGTEDTEVTDAAEDADDAAAADEAEDTDAEATDTGEDADATESIDTAEAADATETVEAAEEASGSNTAADSGVWEVIARVDADEELTYMTDQMKPFSEATYKVIAVDVYGNTVESNTVTCTMKEAVVYSTIWPVKDLTAYTDSEKSKKAGTAEALTAYSVLAEENGMFAIRLDGEICYIDSDYCMINLPDYLGDLCIYDIGNSYSSYFKIHNYKISDVTGTVIEGYENVQLADESFLVPLLYPTAQKLLVAAQTALEKGYQIKIYDSYRPQDATKSIYNLTYSILYEEVDPDDDDDDDYDEDYDEDDDDDGMTYRRLMYGDTGYRLSDFLARKQSDHNYGIALDVTLVDADTGKEIAMQTSMHDISWYSAVSENNKSADLLAEIMTMAGFGTSETEWWHFQDDTSEEELSLSALTDGVSAEGWVADDNGWRYRLADGLYYASSVVTIDGESYTFDADGYAVLPEEETEEGTEGTEE